jgi:signal transduction histidine kinase
MRRRFFRTSVVRLSAVYIVVFALTTSVLLASIFVITRGAIDSETDSVIQAELQGLAERYATLGLRGLAEVIRDRSQGPDQTRSVYLLVDRDWQPVVGNLAAWPVSAYARGDWFEFRMQVKTASGDESHPVRAALITLPGDYRLLVGTDLLERARFERVMTRVAIWSIVLVVCVGSAVGVWMNRRLLKQVHSIASAGRDIADGDFERRLPVRGSGDELDTLATDLNVLLERIEQLTVALRFVIDGTAHDLRGPLSRLRQRVERALADGGTATTNELEAILGDAEAVQRTLDSLLRIAQIQSGAPGAETAILSLGNLSREMVELYEPVAAERHVALAMGTVADGSIRGHRQLLAHAMTNLIDNAVKYSPSGARVEVAVVDEPDAVALVVADTGPGIPQEDRMRVLERFVRLKSARVEPGAGLGLSLVVAVCRLHHASLQLDDNHPGLKVTIRIPRPRQTTI